MGLRADYCLTIGSTFIFWHYRHLAPNHFPILRGNGSAKFTSGFNGPQILNFERSVSVSQGSQSSLVLGCNISLGVPGYKSYLSMRVSCQCWFMLCTLLLYSLLVLTSIDSLFWPQ
jgi:hypothetical protein